ncbi:MAG: hypothetical protein N4A43_02670 [Alphaproteobacteria bacterium]|jgi:hypothetical protein|nr:hypothetical protein [Alphaproteobacteria bacterium]
MIKRKAYIIFIIILLSIFLLLTKAYYGGSAMSRAELLCFDEEGNDYKFYFDPVTSNVININDYDKINYNNLYCKININELPKDFFDEYENVFDYVMRKNK